MIQNSGRPRDESLDWKIITATKDLLLDSGYSALSIDVIVKRAGTSRPAFYRRFNGIPALLLAMLIELFGEAPTVDTGNLAEDLLVIQQNQVRVFDNILVRQCLSGFLDSLHKNEELTSKFFENFFTPRRNSTKAAISRAVMRGEIEAPENLDWICDLLSGPLVMRATFPRMGKLDANVAQQTVDAALLVLGVKRTS